MTDLFYGELLEYLSPQEKTQFEQKIKKVYKAFITDKVLANKLSLDEKTIFFKLKKQYKSSLKSKEEALETFSPDKAIECLIYLMEFEDYNEMESLLIEKMEREKQRKEKQIDYKKKFEDVLVEKEEAEKKFKDLKKEWNDTLKKLKDICDERDAQTKEIEKLIAVGKELDEKLTEKEEAIYKLTAEKEYYEKEISEKDDLITSLQSMIDKKEDKKGKNGKVLVIVKNIQRCSSLEINESFSCVQYIEDDNIQNFIKEINNYDGIIYVNGELSLSTKMKLEKYVERKGNIQKFNTFSEIKKYLKEG